MSKDGEKAQRTLSRHIHILAMFGQGQVLSTKEACDYLERTGDVIDPSLMLRTLKLMRDAGFLEVVNENVKPLQWRWPKGKKYNFLPKMTHPQVIAFRLLERFLEPLLPPDIYRALSPYFTVAQRDVDQMLFWAAAKNWENKVRVIPPAQPLLPPEPPPALAATLTAKAWESRQIAVRETILQALFESQQCQIEYQQLWRDEPVRWMIHPLVYLQRGPAFYLLCTIDDYTDVRQLALHRMHSAKLLDRKASKPTGFDIDREVERSQGMGGNNEPIRLVVRFWKYAGSHLLETRLSNDQTISAEGHDHLRLTATVNDTAQLRWWLLSFGSKVEVLEPEGLRMEMANNAYWMNRMYSKPSSLATHATNESTQP